MNDQEIRCHQMLQRVQTFGQDHASDFTAKSVAAKKFTAVAAAVGQLDALAVTQNSGEGAAHGGTRSKAVSRVVLHDDLAAISRTARALGQDTPGIDGQFRIPRRGGNQALLNAARAFAVDAKPLKDQFIALEMPTDFLDRLATDIDAFENAGKAQTSGRGARASATAGLDATLDPALKAVRLLNAIVRNKYRDDPEVLGAWMTARHIERGPRTAPPTPTPTPPTA